MNTGRFHAALGVGLAEPCGRVEYSGDWARVGSLAVADDGSITAIPRHGITARHAGSLDAARGAVWMRGRTAVGDLGDWRYWPTLGWVIGIIVRDAVGAAEQRCAATSSREDVR